MSSVNHSANSSDEELDRILERKFKELLHEYYHKHIPTERVDCSRYIFDVFDYDFEQKIIKTSVKKPIVVDFWAEWCPPCIMLGPILEDCICSFKGEVYLAKMNVNENPITASKYGIYNIPTVVLFKGGRITNYFIGFMPKEMVCEWLRKALA